MEILIIALRIIGAIIVAKIMGKLLAKIKMPAILGWLIAGMMLGPYAFDVLNEELIESYWYTTALNFFQCCVGLMFARELIFKKLKQSGKQIFVITMFEGFGTFFVVTAFFAVVFMIMGVPFYVALIFGGISLATAPAPALSVVNEFRTKGPVTNTLIPLTVLDDVVAIIVFFTVNSYVTAMGAGGSQSVLSVLSASIIIPFALGGVFGFLVSGAYKKVSSKKGIFFTTLAISLFAFIIAYCVDNFVLKIPGINYMMMGLATFVTIANRLPSEKLNEIMNVTSPLVTNSLMLMIMNLGAPLDFHLIIGAGLLTAIYIIARGIGKYFSTYIGAKVSKAPKTVQKYLGYTLLPHSGVSLVFTGMAVSALTPFDSESATLVKGTIAAAAIINEVIAIIMAKKGFEWAGELNAE